MERKRSFETKLEKFLTGKGFYIVLFLCIAVIGESAWIMLFSGDEPEEIPVQEFAPLRDELLQKVHQHRQNKQPQQGTEECLARNGGQFPQ